ncbi:methylamine dehydrogenase light chain [Komagataeibacter europaeus]|uniref:methylamine dehydrogenase light chain n=1 Tax=Komagataeibacter europaeus TaxID=33995 RepID=UPI000237ED33|nr:methylamine dehydrogenase light chain [Komagataeibacter europaeus]
MTESFFDRLGEKLTRKMAQGISRRSMIARAGSAAVVTSSLPVLPVQRAQAAAAQTPQSAAVSDFDRRAQSTDPTKCDYWRHCAIDGVLCGCCGGGVHTCPPGTQPSPVSWIGTCRNPVDNRSYVIAYRDCCGRTLCNSSPDCHCNTEDRELPVYRPQANNDIIWCFGGSSAVYHCSTAALVGQAE